MLSLLNITQLRQSITQKNSWTHVYINGSTENAVQNGGEVSTSSTQEAEKTKIA